MIAVVAGAMAMTAAYRQDNDEQDRNANRQQRAGQQGCNWQYTYVWWTIWNTNAHTKIWNFAHSFVL